VEVQEEPKKHQADLLFDLPLNSYTEVKAEEEVRYNLQEDLISTSQVNDLEVYGAEEIVFERKGLEKHFVLEDFDAQPTIGKSSSIVEENLVEEAIQFELKTRAPQVEINKIETQSEEVSPLDLTITELKKRAEERRKKMKGFNYKFNDQMNKNIDEIERQPAYKRLGINLDTNTSISNAKTSISSDAEELNLSSNNSFLHDNVD
jgi:cell division protein FtsZ